MSNAAMWMNDAALFSRHFRVLAVDLIGEAGFSAPSRPPIGSDAYACWLDDVLDGLDIRSAIFAGISLGGWMALDYAIRRPQRVDRLAVMCPAGIGRQKRSFYLKALALMLLGPWGKTRLRKMVFGGERQTSNSPELESYLQFMAMLQRHFKPRIVKFDAFTDTQLQALPMPVLAIVGEKDVFFDSAETKRRVEDNVKDARVIWLEDTGHMITNQAEAITGFISA